MSDNRPPCPKSMFYDIPEIEYHVKRSQLNDDIEKLLKDNKFSDFKFIVKEGPNYRQFEVHRCVLSTRSPRFDSWFGGPLSEAEHAFLEPGVIDPEIFSEILAYIYSDDFPNKFPERIHEYLSAATEFQITQLQNKYEEEMFDNFCHYPSYDLIELTFKYMRADIAKLVQAIFSPVQETATQAMEEFDSKFPHLSEMMHMKFQQEVNLATANEVYVERQNRNEN